MSCVFITIAYAALKIERQESWESHCTKPPYSVYSVTKGPTLYSSGRSHKLYCTACRRAIYSKRPPYQVMQCLGRGKAFVPVPPPSYVHLCSPRIAPALFLALSCSSALHRTRAEGAWLAMIGRHFRRAKAVPKVLSLRCGIASGRCTRFVVLSFDELVDRLSCAFGAGLDGLACLKSGCTGLCSEFGRCDLWLGSVCSTRKYGRLRSRLDLHS